MAAKVAIEAWNVVVQRNAVADFKVAREDARPTTDTDNCSGGFMSENARRRHRAVLNLLDVGRADAANGDLDEQFIRADARDGHGFNAQVVHTAINNGAHGFGDIEHDWNLATDEHR